jgi:hypothetical protein
VSSPAAKPRRFFQIHLSTAVVLMFVAGALIGFDVLYCYHCKQVYTCPELSFSLWPDIRWYVIAVLLSGNVAFLILSAMLLEYFARRRERQHP